MMGAGIKTRYNNFVTAYEDLRSFLEGQADEKLLNRSQLQLVNMFIVEAKSAIMSIDMFLEEEEQEYLGRVKNV